MTTDHRTPVCLVTGATSGIGFATAALLARGGAHVIAVGRSPERAETAAREIKQAAGGAGRPAAMAADLSVQAEVRDLAAQVAARHDRLDVLVNCAGAVMPERVMTSDGVETTWAVNYLAPFLLTNLLRDLLAAAATAAAPARVLAMTSMFQAFGRLDLDDPGFARRRYTPFAAYAQSKLATVMFTAELATRLRGTGITANSLHPGAVRTALGRHLNGPRRLLRPFIWLVSKPPARAARTAVDLATAPALAGVTGRYFLVGPPPRPGRPHRLAADAAARERLWQSSAKAVELPEG